MSHLKSRVGSWVFKWKSIPRGAQGSVEVEVSNENKSVGNFQVSWRRDPNGLWVLFPDGLQGFDLNGSKDEESSSGGLSYEVSSRGKSAQWIQVLPTYGDQSNSVVGAKAKKKETRVRAQMPGKIIRVLTEVGKSVSKGESLMVMEAMKMENEIRAPQTGKVTQIKVSQGQAVETGADLVMIGE